MKYDVVLFVDSSIFGGIESHLVELAKLLQRKGVICKVLFYQNHDNQLFYNKLESNNIQFEFLNGSISSLKSAFASFSNDTVVHTHGYKAGILGRLMCKYLKVRCISTYHAGETGQGMVRLYNILDKLTARLSINFAVSKRIKNQLKEAEVLDNFIETTPLAVTSSTYHSANKLKVGFVGRFSYEKGPDRFIEVANHMVKQNMIEWHMFGDGDMQKTLDIPEHVVCHGVVPSEKIWKNIDVLCVTSRQEGLPMAILEAMNHGVMVISLDVGAVSNIITNNLSGWVMPAYDVDLLTRKIEEITKIAPENLIMMKQYAHSIVAQRFSGHAQWTLLHEAYSGQCPSRI
ncbi:glycosyltransferase family 4 protein [Pseudoalteromonas sp. MMG013]|uniref:glycosyltransferase family 4 protein n=1 Tax=Pseudoalteromonas sp. MMG013 TaxID=2822687 RepID=UPI001B3793F6|nr:glycosyltransferase family 4 protein [Pseudoalteromonas sp. MMG013]MBQ4863529.1 glycosyltransferase family 4 protein [Pseudoalteromonas sp. MMG013]